MRLLGLLLATLSLPTVLVAQGLPAADPATPGLTAAGHRALDSLLNRYSQSDRFPGVMLLVARHGKVAYWKAAGVRDLDGRAPLGTTDVFRIFSLTKPITVAAVLMLVEEGKIALDDPVAKYVPALAALRVTDGPGRTRPPRAPMTIRHLLTFTSGFSYGLFPPFGPADSLIRAADIVGRSRNLDDAMNRIAALPLVSDPGVAATYGWQMDVLGKVIERVSEMTLDRFFARRIFGPLKMHETAFMVDAANLSRVPTLYEVTPGRPPTRAGDAEWTGAYGQPPRTLWGGGGLVSTAGDYLRFAQMIANKGELDGVRLLRESTVEMMTTANVPPTFPGVEERLGKGFTFGFGCMVATDIVGAGGGGSDGLYYFAGSANLFAWADRRSGIVALAWAQSLPFQVYPFFPDARRVVARALEP